MQDFVKKNLEIVVFLSETLNKNIRIKEAHYNNQNELVIHISSLVRNLLAFSIEVVSRIHIRLGVIDEDPK